MLGKPLFMQGYRWLGIEACARPHFCTLDTLPREVHSAIILGAWIYNGVVTPVLQERLDLALRLYAVRPELKFILSGSPSKPGEPGDVDVMRDYLVAHGLPVSQLTLDYQGWTTFKSFAAWRQQGLPQRFILVTSRFHVPRAVYIAVQLGLEPFGLLDEQAKPKLNARYGEREVAASYKAWLQCRHFTGRQQRILKLRQLKKWLHKKVAHPLTSWLPATLRNQMIIRYYVGYWPSLRQPRTFVEKLLAYMRSAKMEEYAPYTDKLAVRKYVAQQVGEKYLTKLYGVYHHYDEVDFAKLPAKFYLKLNHGCKWNLPCEGKEKFVQESKAHREFMEQHLQENYADKCGERQYRNIKPQLYAEEYLDLPRDAGNMVRIFAFGGVPKFIQVNGKLAAGPNLVPRTFNNFYDCEWQLQPFVIGAPSDMVYAVPKPANLAELLAVAAKLAAPFPFVRVDLYNLGSRIVFSELTFTPNTDHAPVTPREWDRKLGDLFVL
jgi:vancomycin permeability regulator SanA